MAEHGFLPLRIEGRLPDDLRGTLVRNGPGLFELFGTRVRHAFMADGGITAIRLGGGGAAAAGRVTASAGLRAERAAGRALFGDAVAWPRRVRNLVQGRYKNTANTSVLAWQGRLLALMEGARPTELRLTDGDVETVGETDLGVVGAMFSAHPHRVAAHRTTYNFGLRYGKRPAIVLYALPDAGPARRLGEVELGWNPMLHDFIATERHLVFFVAPVVLSVPRMMLQLGDFASLWRWQPRRGTEVIVVPLDEPSRPTRFTVPAFYQWHFANAWSPSASEVVVDLVQYPDFASFGALTGTGDGAGPVGEELDGQLHRARIELTARRLVSEPRWDRPCEFPRVHPAREGAAHDHTWLAGDDLRTIARIDGEGRAEVADLGAAATVSEPVFVPRAGGGDEAAGWVLTLCHDRAQDLSYLAILDGARPADGPVARCWLDHPVPITFHGAWVPA